MKRTAFLPLLLFAAVGFAAPLKVKLVGAPRAVLLTGDAPPLKSEGPYLDGPNLTILESSQKNSTAYLVAEDGSVVARKWADLAKDSTIDFGHPTHLAKVAITATRGGEAVGGAVIELKDADRTQRIVLGDATTDRGRAEFRFVRVGRATATGRARGANNATEQVTLDVNVAPGEPPAFVLPFGASGPPTPAVPASGAASGASNAPAPQPTGAGFFSNLVSVFLGLLVAGGAAFALWTYARKNPDKVKLGLQKIGADVPEPPPPAPDPVPAAPAPPEPPAQILLGPADPVLPIAPLAPAAPIAVGAPTGTPALVAADGSVFDLPEGETIVGREAIGGLMLSHESVSRRHARLVRSGGSVTVEDLGSTNGTFVDGRRLTSPEPVAPGQSLRFGTLDYALRG